MMKKKPKRCLKKLKKAQFDLRGLSGKHEADEKYGWTFQHHEHAAGTWRYGNGQGMKGLDDEQTAQAEKNMARMEAIIYSMTAGREKKSGCC